LQLKKEMIIKESLLAQTLGDFDSGLDYRAPSSFNNPAGLENSDLRSLEEYHQRRFLLPSLYTVFTEFTSRDSEPSLEIQEPIRPQSFQPEFPLGRTAVILEFPAPTAELPLPELVPAIIGS